MRANIHFEGLPGAGKTTASEQFCSLLKSYGIDASWWREGAPNHPIISKEGCVPFREHDYTQIYLGAWRSYLESLNRTVVLDGYAFQSTVRFLYANRIARTQIEDYFRRWQELAPGATLIYFIVENPTEHFNIVLTERGDEWAHKLYTYVERTPLGVANGYFAKEGFVEFWSNYQQLCLELLDAAYVPVHLIGSRSWKDDDLQALAAKAGLLT